MLLMARSIEVTTSYCAHQTAVAHDHPWRRCREFDAFLRRRNIGLHRHWKSRERFVVPCGTSCVEMPP